MYSKAFFVERFREFETSELLLRYVSVELTEDAKAAIMAVLAERDITPENMAPLLHQARKARYRQTKGTRQCDCCGNSALFGVRDGGQRFCSQACLKKMRLMEASLDIPEEEIIQHAHTIQTGPCPLCGRTGVNITVRNVYRIWSALLITQWRTDKVVCCADCGRRANRAAIGWNLLLGWWAIPYGLLFTPKQIGLNFLAMREMADDGGLSADLLDVARMELAGRLGGGGLIADGAEKA